MENGKREDKESLGQNVKKYLTDCWKKVDEFVDDELTKRHVVAKGRCRLNTAIEDLIAAWLQDGYQVRKFQFEEDGEIGTLIQVCRNEGRFKEALKTATGLQLAVCVKMLPLGEDLALIVGNGKWLDKVFSGVVSWALLPPLLVVPLAGAWRQRKMIENIMNDVLVWFANHPPTRDDETEEYDDCAEEVALLCEKISKADWVREEAAMGGPHADSSGSLNFKLNDQITLQLAFCPVGEAEGYWSSLKPVTEEQWHALMSEVQWSEMQDEGRLDEFCGRLSRQYQIYMPKRHVFRWRKVTDNGQEGFLVMLIRDSD